MFALLKCLFVIFRLFGSLLQIFRFRSFLFSFLLLFLHGDIEKEISPEEEKDVEEVAKEDGHPFSIFDVIGPVVDEKERIHAEINIPDEDGNEHDNKLHRSDRLGGPDFRNYSQRNDSGECHQNDSI